MLLKRLTESAGLPGFESGVRGVIMAEIKAHVDSMRVDRMGNLIAVKNERASGPHIALSAHMDEVGLAVKGIDSDGYLRVASWGVDPRILPAKTVLVGKNKIPGVIGFKPWRLTSEAERDKAAKTEDLSIDIGAFTKEEAAELVSPGDYAAFDSEFMEFGAHKIKAKALDDRVGCAVIIGILQSNMPYKISAVFNTQEEVGLRGSSASANQIFADLVINLEGTICADTSGVPEHLRVTTQGMGPAISLSDRTSVYFKKYREAILKTARDNGIPCQFRQTGMGGTDSANFHAAHGGAPVIGLAVPCRYIHSPVSVMDKRDFENTGALTAKFIEYFNQTGGLGRES
ncbi:MAG: M28 family peptidase [Clostridiales bacterium]|jgi:endoglucanase|nr:M28 family peptidase [Clostridiales bacterium]